MDIANDPLPLLRPPVVQRRVFGEPPHHQPRARAPGRGRARAGVCHGGGAGGAAGDQARAWAGAVRTEFLAGKLMNVANNREHWRTRHHYTKTWREKVKLSPFRCLRWIPEYPKRIRLEAKVWNLFDAHDGLRGALKPVVDGLVDVGIIHSDAPDCGHIFEYEQAIDRKSLGVRITIEALPT